MSCKLFILLELKQVYRPVRVEKGEKADSFVFRSMLEFENAGQLLDCVYEITQDGRKVAEGAVSFDLPPMGSTEIIIPDAAVQFDRETYIRFIFTAKDSTLFCEK